MWFTIAKWYHGLLVKTLVNFWCHTDPGLFIPSLLRWCLYSGIIICHWIFKAASLTLSQWWQGNYSSPKYSSLWFHSVCYWWIFPYPIKYPIKWDMEFFHIPLHISCLIWISILRFRLSGFIILVLCIIPSIFMRHKNYSCIWCKKCLCIIWT